VDRIELPLRDIWEAPSCRADQLETVTDELTPEEVERITDAGQWKDFREEDLTRTVLPELGPALFFTERIPFYTADSYSRGTPAGPPEPEGIVVAIRGRNYRVSLRVLAGGRDSDHEARGKTLILVPTDEPATPSDVRVARVATSRSRREYQFFGQPVWVQNAHYPADLRGEPCSHLVTVENGWGDMGNWNILVGFDADGVPNVAYFEASCC
jgi:hypothetical protein